MFGMMGEVTDETSGTAEPMTDGDMGARLGRRRRAAARAARRLRLLLTVAAVVLILDIVTKVLAVRLLTPGQPVSIVVTPSPGHWCNSGAAFSMATGYTWALTLIATGVVMASSGWAGGWSRRGGPSASA